jgi:hypothetical protein
VTAASVQAREFSSVDVTSHDFWSQPFTVRDERFAQLRAGQGLSWHRPMPSLFPMEEPGFWALEMLGVPHGGPAGGGGPHFCLATSWPRPSYETCSAKC